MISAPELSQHSPSEDSFDGRSGNDECQRQLAAAEREMGAFVVAVRKLFGPVAATDAANHWIELAQTIDLPLIPRCHDWRFVTIQAASRLATDYGEAINTYMPPPTPITISTSTHGYIHGRGSSDE